MHFFLKPNTRLLSKFDISASGAGLLFRAGSVRLDDFRPIFHEPNRGVAQFAQMGFQICSMAWGAFFQPDLDSWLADMDGGGGGSNLQIWTTGKRGGGGEERRGDLGYPNLLGHQDLGLSSWNVIIKLTRQALLMYSALSNMIPFYFYFLMSV